jgi:hypothetical protein
VYFSTQESIAGDIHAVSWFEKFVMSTFQGSKDSGLYWPAIESTAGIHVVQVYRYQDVFCCHRIFHFKEISHVSPDINQWRQNSSKNHPNTLQRIAVLFCKMFLADFQDWLLYYHLPPTSRA